MQWQPGQIGATSRIESTLIVTPERVGALAPHHLYCRDKDVVRGFRFRSRSADRSPVAGPKLRLPNDMSLNRPKSRPVVTSRGTSEHPRCQLPSHVHGRSRWSCGDGCQLQERRMKKPASNASGFGSWQPDFVTQLAFACVASRSR